MSAVSAVGLCFVFFFKEKTAYEMRISDWGSDVCASDLLAPDLVEGEVLRRMACGRGDRHGGEDTLRVARRPLQHLHAAHRAADHAEQLADAEMVEQHRLRIDHVADGDDREIQDRKSTRLNSSH